MFSTSQKIRRRAFFSIWKEGIHPIGELSADIKRLLYPQMRDCILISKDEFYSSSSIPNWVSHGSLEVKFCLEQNIQQTNWHFKNTEVHALIVRQRLFFLWVDIPQPTDINDLINILNIQLIQQKPNERYISTWELVLHFTFQKLQDFSNYHQQSI